MLPTLSRKLVLAFLWSLVALTTAPSAFASGLPDTWVDGRFYTTSPTYYTATRGDLGASFRDELPWGTRVELHFGYGGEWLQGTSCSGCSIAWYDAGIVEATPVGPYTWTAWVDHSVYERSQQFWLTKLQFVWVVTLPNNTSYIVRGGPSPNGYFEAQLLDVGTTLSIARDEAQFERLAVTVIY